MNEILDEVEKDQSFSDREIFMGIWTNPRAIFKYIHAIKHDKYITVLLVLAGISRTFDRASTKNMGDEFPLIAIIFFAIVAGSLFGWLTYYIYAAILSWVGKWLKGDQDTKSILRIISYSMIPALLGLGFFLLQILFFGIDLFKSDGIINIEEDTVTSILFYGLVALQVIFSLWTIVLVVIGLSEIQKFSIGKSILNLILPIFVILIPIFLFIILSDVIS